MSILIKGMEMPISCGSCFVGDRTICSDGCPLIELPPHGRLIDADALLFECNTGRIRPWESFVTHTYVNDAPTIIEAEEDGET